MADFQQCFTEMRQTNWMSLRESDALLYAPSIEDIQDNCDRVSLKCYTEELTMVLNEEEIAGETVDCVFDFNEALEPPLDGCPVCETYPLGNITIFLDRLDTLLKRMTTQNNV